MTPLTPAAARLLQRALEQIRIENERGKNSPALTSAHLTVIRQLEVATERLIKSNGNTSYLDAFIMRKFPRIPLDEIHRQLAAMTVDNESLSLPPEPVRETLALPHRAEMSDGVAVLAKLIEDLRCKN